MSTPLSIAIVHLGCEKNRVDSEHMMGLLEQSGAELTTDLKKATYVIVNTCSFIEAAREESVQTIVGLEREKKKVIIAGCMAQHFKEELLKEFPTAQAVVGTGDYGHIASIIKRVEQGERVNAVSEKPVFLADESVPRAQPKGTSTAWLRVAEGCNYRCSFCIIPHLRGDLRSRTIESIVSEAKTLQKNGIQEIILVAQNTTAYGVDLYGKPSIAKLLSALAETGIPWIRMHYAYPTGLTNEVIETMKAHKNILPYFDIPLQHAHAEILKAMNRPWQEESTENLISRIRTAFPNAVLRTTFIVGFPGEKKKHFDALLAFAERAQFDHLGVFCFSPEEGTEAFSLPGRVSKTTMLRRQDALMSMQQSISAAKNRSCVGKKMDILVEKENPNKAGSFIGRSYRFSPDVDGVVYIEGKVKVGSIVTANIVDSDIYDLHAEI